MEAQLNEDEYHFSFEYNLNTWKTWMESRKELLKYVEESKNDNLYRQTANYHVMQNIKHNCDPYRLIKTLIDLNHIYSDKMHQLISLSPPPNIILARTPEDYDKIVKDFKDK